MTAALERPARGEPTSLLPRSPRPSNHSTATALAIWAALIAVAAGWGTALLRLGTRMQIGTPPLTGTLDLRLGVGVLPAVVVGGLAVMIVPLGAQRLPWRALLMATPVVTAGWAIAVNLVDGWGALTAPVHTEYAATAARIVSPSQFLSHFTVNIGRYNLHTQGHPPAMELILWLVDRFGWHGSGAAATLYIAMGSVAGVAALVALREVAGEARARTAAPFVAIFPGAIWLATSGDAFFAGVSAWAIALVVLATGRQGRRAGMYAFAGGLLFGLTAFLSYGLVLLAVVPLAIAARRRRWRVLAIATAGAAAVFVGFALAGFSWLAGLRLAHARYYAGVASRRPYGYFLVADLAAFAIVVGPAAAVAFGRLRDRAAWILPSAALVALALADLSGMSKAEVERIWLPFAPWVLLACAAFTVPIATRAAARRTRWLLAGQVATAVVLQLAIRSPW